MYLIFYQFKQNVLLVFVWGLLPLHMLQEDFKFKGNQFDKISWNDYEFLIHIKIDIFNIRPAEKRSPVKCLSLNNQ